MSCHVSQRQVRKICGVIGGVTGVVTALPIAASVESVSLIVTRFIGGSAIGREVADEVKRIDGGE